MFKNIKIQWYNILSLYNIQYSLYLLSTHILLLINIVDFIIHVLFFLKDYNKDVCTYNQYYVNFISWYQYYINY